MSDKIALVFDFDDTLVPDSTTLFLVEKGIDVEDFWAKKYKSLLSRGYDSTLAWLKLFLENVGNEKPFGPVSNKDLNAFGKSLDKKFYPGLPKFFDDVINIASEFEIGVEFYIISGGLQAVIEGSKIVKKYFKAVYGCLLEETGNPPMISHIKRSINFTEKTRYLFEINKGISPQKAYKNPYLVNRDIPMEKRRIPFENMIYVGDGLTDIPCFSLLRHQKVKGNCFAVCDLTNEDKVRRAVIEFLWPNRVLSMHAPKYNKEAELGSYLRATVAALCNRISLSSQTV